MMSKMSKMSKTFLYNSREAKKKWSKCRITKRRQIK